MTLAFDFAPEDEVFRSELRQFLADELPADWQGIFVEGDDGWNESLRLCRALADRKWLVASWPGEYGGGDTGIWTQTVVQEELWAHNEPRGPQYMNVNWIGPAIMHFGTDEQKRRFLPPMARGELTWSQGFSEPEAGSDLAALRTTAIPDDDVFVVNGQKIWISYGDKSDYLFLLARSDPESKRKDGMSVLLVDLDTPGITRRPITTVLGYHRQSELFFDDVIVPRSALLGEMHRGWDVAMAALAFERSGSARYARSARIMGLLEHAHAHGWGDDRIVEFASLLAFGRASELVNYEVVSLKEQGVVPRWQASAARLHNSILEQEVADFAEVAAGLDSMLYGSDDAAPFNGEIEAFWRNAQAATVTAGAYEIQMGIIARTGLEVTG